MKKLFFNKFGNLNSEKSLNKFFKVSTEQNLKSCRKEYISEIIEQFMKYYLWAEQVLTVI